METWSHTSLNAQQCAAFAMFAGFCGHADKNHIYTILTVTTGALRSTTNASMALSENEFDTAVL